MKCFVASAFFQSDTDRLYDETLAPVLADKGITAVRVDRLNHNDNIDDKIMAEIRQASLMIADLTYARPSVYYEAGFAERQIPVIYTVRRDHFSPTSEDILGNRKVHFDLSMKNIITWSTPDDFEFRVALSGRIDLVLRRTLDRLRRRPRTNMDKTPDVSSDDICTSAATILKSQNFVGIEALKRAGRSGTFIYADKEWYRLSEGILYWVRFSYPEFVPSFIAEGYSAQDVEYNLNALGRIAEILSIREVWIYGRPCDDEGYRQETIVGDLTAVRDFDVNIPVLDSSFEGDVFLDTQNLSGVISSLFGGTDYKQGFRTKAPPTGTTHVRADVHKEFRFVHSGFVTRVVPVERFVYRIDEVASVKEFERRFIQALQSDPGA